MRQGSFQLPRGSGEDSAACWGLLGTACWGLLGTAPQPHPASLCNHGGPAAAAQSWLETQVLGGLPGPTQLESAFALRLQSPQTPWFTKLLPPVSSSPSHSGASFPCLSWRRQGPEGAGTCLGSHAQPSGPSSAKPQFLGPTWPVSLTVKCHQDSRAKQGPGVWTCRTACWCTHMSVCVPLHVHGCVHVCARAVFMHALTVRTHGFAKLLQFLLQAREGQGLARSHTARGSVMERGSECSRRSSC